MLGALSSDMKWLGGHLHNFDGFSECSRAAVPGMRFLDGGLSVAWPRPADPLLGGPQEAGLPQARRLMRVPKFENH